MKISRKDWEKHVKALDIMNQMNKLIKEINKNPDNRELREEYERLKIPLRELAPGEKNLLDDDEYYTPFKEFCNDLKGKLIEERGIAGDNISPYHILSCYHDRNKIQLDFSQTGDKKKIYLRKNNGYLFTIDDKDMSSISITAEPTDRTFITRDFINPVTQTHQISGEYRTTRITVHKGNYKKMYSIELK